MLNTPVLWGLIREGVRKKPISYGPFLKRGGGEPLDVTKIGVYFWKREKYAECHEMEKFAQIFYDIFARVSVNNLDILRYLDGYFHKSLKCF